MPLTQQDKQCATRIAIEKIRGTAWMGVLFEPYNEPIDIDIQQFRRKAADFDSVVLDTLAQIALRQIKLDGAHATRVRIKDVHEQISKEPDTEKRMPLLKLLAELHEQVYAITKNQTRVTNANT